MLRQKVGELQFCAPAKPGAYTISAVRDRCAVCRVMKSGPRKELYVLKTRPGKTGEHLQTLGSVSIQVGTSEVQMGEGQQGELVDAEARSEKSPHSRKGAQRRKQHSLTQLETEGEPIPLSLRKGLRGFDTVTS